MLGLRAGACEEAGIIFVGPTSTQLSHFGDKTHARQLAIDNGLPVVPATPGAVATAEEARHYIDTIPGFEYPVIVKASFGGGGRGMRVVHKQEDLEEAFQRCSSEALVGPCMLALTVTHAQANTAAV